MKLSNLSLNRTYSARHIVAGTQVVVPTDAELKAGTDIRLKPGFTTLDGSKFDALIKDSIFTPQRYYYVKDHLGSIRVTVDQAGEIISYDDYDPWGMQLEGRSDNLASNNEKFKFTGKERDTETNYDYFGARYYDSRLGRWLQVDPSQDENISWGSYSYAFCNPIRVIDPNGRNGWDFLLGLTTSVVRSVNPSFHGTDVGSYSGNRSDYAVGRVVGDVVSMFIGGSEIAGGSSGTGSGIALSSTGAGAVIGVPLAAISAGVTAHGVVTTSVAITNLGSDLNSMNSEGTSNSGRSKNDLKPDQNAEGPHTTFKTDKNGNVTNHATWEPNSKNPKGWDIKQSTDITGDPHFDKNTKTDVSTPHTHTMNGVRPALPCELPKKE